VKVIRVPDSTKKISTPTFCMSGSSDGRQAGMKKEMPWPTQTICAATARSRSSVTDVSFFDLSRMNIRI
jgi:hypothetical protein